MRAPRNNDFSLELDGVGTFVFGRRTYGDRIKIRADYLRRLRELGEAEETADQELAMFAATLSTFSVMCVSAPPGWESLEDIDLISNPDAEDQIIGLYLALKNKEDSFRQGAGEAVQGAGEAAS